MTTYQLYKITGPDGRGYIGCTRQALKKRRRQHWYDSTRLKPHCSELQAAMREHGVASFEIGLLCYVVGSEKAALKREQELIELHGTLYPQGFNLRFGTSNHPSTRQKMSASHRTPASRAKIRAARLGQQHTIASRQKMSAGRRGENNANAKLTAEQVQWVRKAVTFKTRADVAAMLGVSAATISGIAAGKYWTNV